MQSITPAATSWRSSRQDPPGLDPLEHILGGVVIVLSLLVRVVKLVCWVILQDGSTHNRGCQTSLLSPLFLHQLLGGLHVGVDVLEKEGDDDVGGEWPQNPVGRSRLVP